MADSATYSKGEIGIGCFADNSRGRKMAERRRQTMDSSAFLINGDERKIAGGLRERATQRMDLRRIAAITAEENKSAKIVGLADVQFGCRQFIRANTHHQHLTDLEFELVHNQRF
jgi:hypothetical protein